MLCSPSLKILHLASLLSDYLNYGVILNWKLFFLIIMLSCPPNLDHSSVLHPYARIKSLSCSCLNKLSCSCLNKCWSKKTLLVVFWSFISTLFFLNWTSTLVSYSPLPHKGVWLREPSPSPDPKVDHDLSKPVILKVWSPKQAALASLELASNAKSRAPSSTC